MNAYLKQFYWAPSGGFNACSGTLQFLQEFSPLIKIISNKKIFNNNISICLFNENSIIAYLNY